MKTGSFFKMIELDDDKEIKFCSYECFIDKLMYLTRSIKPDIAFVIRQLSRHHANPRKNYI